jgi:hypothetical protein
MAQVNPKIYIGSYRDNSSYYAEGKPVQGQGIFQSSKMDIQLKKKEPAKPKHAVLIGAIIVAGIIYLSTKLDERM